MGHPELMSTKSTSVLLLMSSATLVMVSGKQPSTWRHKLEIKTEAFNKNGSSQKNKHCPNQTAAIQLLQGVLKSLNNLWCRHLDTKDIFTFVPLQEGPLWLLPLQQVCAHGHLPAGDVRSKALAHTTERQISTLRRGKYSVKSWPYFWANIWYD